MNEKKMQSIELEIYKDQLHNNRDPQKSKTAIKQMQQSAIK